MASRELKKDIISGVIGLGLGAALAAQALRMENSHETEDGIVEVNFRDIAQLGEGVVFIEDQTCPQTERPLGAGEAIVYEFEDGGVQGHMFSISPEAVYQSVHAPAIYCGTDAGLGNPFEGYAIVIAGDNTEFSEG